MDKEKILKAGAIAKQVKDFARSIIIKNASLLEIAERIENKIIELKGKPAFPVNLSINEIAAHYTPSYNDEAKASGLIKIDFGVHINGWTADTAFSVDLENTSENKNLIEAAETALQNASEIIKAGVKASEIGTVIQETIESFGVNPIINLSGHQMMQYELHAGNTIPNINDNRASIITPGLYAIEPFASNGSGKVHDGKPSGIYMLQDSRTPRSEIAREILNYIVKEYNTLPFCSRWLIKKFGTKALIGLKQLEESGQLHHFSQLVENPESIVAQAENTFLVEDKVVVTTE